MLAFEGSPLKKLSLEDPDEHDAHENLLNTAMIKHLHVINWCMSDLGSRAYRMTPKMFLEDVYGIVSRSTVKEERSSIQN